MCLSCFWIQELHNQCRESKKLNQDRELGCYEYVIHNGACIPECPSGYTTINSTTYVCLSVCLSLFLSYTHTDTHTHARPHTLNANINNDLRCNCTTSRLCHRNRPSNICAQEMVTFGKCLLLFWEVARLLRRCWAKKKARHHLSVCLIVKCKQCVLAVEHAALRL